MVSPGKFFMLIVKLSRRVCKEVRFLFCEVSSIWRERYHSMNPIKNCNPSKELQFHQKYYESIIFSLLSAVLAGWPSAKV